APHPLRAIPLPLRQPRPRPAKARPRRPRPRLRHPRLPRRERFSPPRRSIARARRTRRAGTPQARGAKTGRGASEPRERVRSRSARPAPRLELVQLELRSRGLARARWGRGVEPRRVQDGLAEPTEIV